MKSRDRRTLWLDFVLDNKSFALVVNLLGELGGDGVMSGGILQHQTLIALDTLEHGGFFDGPLPDVSPVFVRGGIFLLGMGRSPSLIPVIGELLQEGSFEGGRLKRAARSADVQYVERSSEFGRRYIDWTGLTHGESGTLDGRGSGIGCWHFDIVSKDVTHQAGRRHQGRCQRSVETHGEANRVVLDDSGIAVDRQERETERERKPAILFYFCRCTSRIDVQNELEGNTTERRDKRQKTEDRKKSGLYKIEAPSIFCQRWPLLTGPSIELLPVAPLGLAPIR